MFVCVCVFQKIEQHLHAVYHNFLPIVVLSMYTGLVHYVYSDLLLTTLLQSCLEPKPQESMPHHLPFMQPGAESTELGALYLRVRKVMVGMHERRARMKSFIDIAKEW